VPTEEPIVTATRRYYLVSALAFCAAACVRAAPSARTAAFLKRVGSTVTGKIARLNPATLPDAGVQGYSQISIAEPGRLAIISGQVAWRASKQPAPATLAGQAAIVVANARAALTAAGAAAKDLLIVRVYLVDLTPERLEELLPHLRQLFDGAKPSVTGVGVPALAGRELQLEIEMTVRLPG
jgi:enamine deaminase RidA (YjgF/YER057c/UK114 family)